MIKDTPIEDLRTASVEILSKAFFELRQNPSEDDIVAMSLTLAEDLKIDFPNLEIQDIRMAFQ